MTETNEDARMQTYEPVPFEGLVNIDMSFLMKRTERHNKENKNVCGCLPMMCRLSPFQGEALNAQSFVERMNSRGKATFGDK